MFKAIWSYRYFIISSIKNEFKSRFVRSKLGGLWMILHPLAMVMIYALILSSLLKAKIPGVDSVYAYPIYLTAGILSWNIFAESVSRSLNIFIGNANLIKKVAFPKLVLPLITAGTILLDGIVLLLVILVVFAFLGYFPGTGVLWFPFLFLITLMFGMSMGLMLGVLNVFIRDIGHIIPILLQFGFWLTPIVYTLTIIPSKYQFLFLLNPMTYITQAFHEVFLYHKIIHVYGLMTVAGISFLFLLLGLYIFKKASAEMVDYL